MPTHTNDRLGNNRWGAGPSLVALKMPGNLVYGTLLAQMWDITDSRDDDISALTLQPFFNYNFGGGWYVNTAPIITANWEAKGSDQWTIPVGGGIGRVVHIGKQAINFRASFYANVAKPEYGPDYDVQLMAIFLFPE